MCELGKYQDLLVSWLHIYRGPYPHAHTPELWEIEFQAPVQLEPSWFEDTRAEIRSLL